MASRAAISIVAGKLTTRQIVTLATKKDDKEDKGESYILHRTSALKARLAALVARGDIPVDITDPLMDRLDRVHLITSGAKDEPVEKAGSDISVGDIVLTSKDLPIGARVLIERQIKIDTDEHYILGGCKFRVDAVFKEHIQITGLSDYGVEQTYWIPISLVVPISLDADTTTIDDAIIRIPKTMGMIHRAGCRPCADPSFLREIFSDEAMWSDEDILERWLEQKHAVAKASPKTPCRYLSGPCCACESGEVRMGPFGPIGCCSCYMCHDAEQEHIQQIHRDHKKGTCGICEDELWPMIESISSSHYCDMCKASFTPGDERHSCPECDVDYCEKCV